MPEDVHRRRLSSYVRDMCTGFGKQEPTGSLSTARGIEACFGWKVSQSRSVWPSPSYCFGSDGLAVVYGRRRYGRHGLVRPLLDVSKWL